MNSTHRALAVPVLVVLGLVAIGVVITGLPSVRLELSPAAPSMIRFEGNASERVRATGSRVTAADRARATERAQWKAYYFAQLRAAEATGRISLDARTTIRTQVLANQRLEATFSDLIHTAASVPEETTVTIDDNVARARVVVEVPSERVTSLWRQLRSIKINVRWPQRVHTAAARERTTAVSREPAPPPAERRAAPPANGFKPARSEAKSPRSRPASPSRGQAATASGATVQIPATGSFPGVVPTFYDAAGTLLGSVGQLDSEGVLAGLPLVGANDPAAARHWAGASPRRYRGTVSDGDVFLWDSLSSEHALFFREALQTGRVVLVLGDSR